MKHLLTQYGRIVIPKKGMNKNDAFKTILEVQGIELSDAEQVLVSKYIRGEISKEALQEEMMNLPLED